MKRFLQLGLLALGLGWALPALAQNECGGLQVIQTTRDSLGRLHQVECFDPSTGQVTLPLVNSLTPSTIAGNPVVTGALTAQSLNDKLCVGAAPCYATTTLAATAAGSVNKTIIEIRSSYAGTDCGPAQDNLVYLDYRGMNPPCNTNNSISYNPATSAVPHMLLEPILFMTSPANGTASTPIQSSAFVTGTLPGNGGIVDGFAATAFTTGAVTGTLGTLRGAEIAASIPSGGGTVNNAQGVAGYVAGLGGATTAIGTVQGVLGTGCNIQTYGAAPTNCFGMEAANQQSKASSRNYSAGFDSLALILFDAAQTNGGFDCEDSSHVTHTCIRVDSNNLLSINAIAGAGVALRDNGPTTRLRVDGGGVTIGPVVTTSTTPTITAAGCGGSAASIVSNTGGSAAFELNVGTAPTSGGCTITMPSATTGWNCDCSDLTTTSTTVFYCKQTGAVSQTSVVLQNFSDVAAATAFNASDHLRVKCAAY